MSLTVSLLCRLTSQPKGNDDDDSAPVNSDRAPLSLTGLGALTGAELRAKWVEFIDKLELFLMQHSSNAFDQGGWW